MNPSLRTDVRYPGPMGTRRSAPACPRCSGETDRIPRRTLDFMVSVLVRVRRYRCMSLGCNWEGMLRKTLGVDESPTHSCADRRRFL